MAYSNETLKSMQKRHERKGKRLKDEQVHKTRYKTVNIEQHEHNKNSQG